MSHIAVIGAGGLAREVTETLVSTGVDRGSISYYVARKFLETTSGLSPIHDLEDLILRNGETEAFLAVGDGALRESFYLRLGDKVSYPSLFHPSSIIGEDCLFGIGTTVLPLCSVTANVRVGCFAKLGSHIGIGHDSVIGDYFTASPKVTVSGNVKIGKHVFLGTASVILPGITICDHVIVGAGAVVTKDISEPGTYVGIPAKLLNR